MIKLNLATHEHLTSIAKTGKVFSGSRRGRGKNFGKGQKKTVYNVCILMIALIP